MLRTCCVDGPHHWCGGLAPLQFVVGKVALDDCLEGLYNSKQIESLLYLIEVTSVLVIFFYSLFIL